MKTVLKVLAALAAIAGVVFLIATYGDKIVAWAKKLLGKCPCANECECVDEAAEEPAEEAVEAPVEEAPVEEIVVEASEPIAEDSDFEA